MSKPQVRADHIWRLVRPAGLRREMRKVHEPGHAALLDQDRAKNLDRLHELQDRGVAADTQWRKLEQLVVAARRIWT